MVANASEYDFFQLMTLLREYNKNNRAIQFSVAGNLAFPNSDIESLQYIEEDEPYWQVTINFLGLIGPSGVLPPHYTELLLEQAHQKRFALKEFIDLLHQRIITFYYEVWIKTHFYFNFNAKNSFEQPNDIMDTLGGHVGLSVSKKLQSLNFTEKFLLCHAGIFAKKRPTPSELRTLIEYYSKLHVEIVPYYKKKYYFLSSQASCLSSRAHINGNNCLLSINTHLGDAINLYQNYFKIIIYVKSFEQLNNLLPDKSFFKNICDITQRYVGIDYSFSIELSCNLSVIESCKLSDVTSGRLGWNSWINHKKNYQNVSNILSIRIGDK